MIKPGAVVIDVGINELDGKTVGDVDYDAVKILHLPLPCTRRCWIRNNDNDARSGIRGNMHEMSIAEGAFLM